MGQRDLLLVISQDADLAGLQDFCQAENVRSVLVLTTHRCFPAEQEKLQRIAAEVELTAYADLLSEPELIRCDRLAEEALQSRQGVNEADYVKEFMARSVREKNRMVHERLLGQNQFKRVFYLPGLGVDGAYWSQFGCSLGTIIPTTPGGREKKESPKVFRELARGLKKIKARWPRTEKMEVHEIRREGKTYIFLSALKRLNILPETQIRTRKLSGRNRKAGGYLSPDWLHREFGPDAVFCMTIHDYQSLTAKALGGVWVFVDGYHPSNYPRSYIDGYGENDIFVVRTMFDERWFSSHGKRTRKPPAFIRPEFFSPVTVKTARRVLVALNHAGDWTALINRSDTDDLVLATVRLAEKIPEVSVRVRAHPTMDHPAHEGTHASERIRGLISSAGLANLQVSTQDLGEDLSWCEVCLSEYSQVLLDAVRAGKLGLAVNLTPRRSFMQDYSDLGFYHAEGIDRAREILSDMAGDPQNASLQQNHAVARYNELLTGWREGKSGVRE